MNNKLTNLPKLLKRKHILKDIGLSESLYYKLVKENKLPTIKINNRIFSSTWRIRDNFKPSSFILMEGSHERKKRQKFIKNCIC